MKTQYRTVDTSTLKGLELAERLHTHGWKIIRAGFWSIQFEKKQPVCNNFKPIGTGDCWKCGNTFHEHNEKALAQQSTCPECERSGRSA